MTTETLDWMKQTLKNEFEEQKLEEFWDRPSFVVTVGACTPGFLVLLAAHRRGDKPEEGWFQSYKWFTREDLNSRDLKLSFPVDVSNIVHTLDVFLDSEWEPK